MEQNGYGQVLMHLHLTQHHKIVDAFAWYSMFEGMSLSMIHQ